MVRKTMRLLGLGALMATVSLVGCGGGDPTIDAGELPDVPDLPDVLIECTRDSECNDGIFCNGTEACELGRCMRTALDCGDGVDCTMDSCSEDMRACVHAVPDLDSDGYFDARCLDERGMPLGNDCDDTDAARFPGNLEVCDDEGHDEDCDLTTRGGVDADSDGYEDHRCCNPMAPGSTGMNCGDDCDDGRRSTNPGGTEVCNGLNDDCDAATDEGVSITVYLDADHDGYGVTEMTVEACGDTAGYATEPGDCDDTRIDRNPGQPEFCDMVDNDCNGMVDDMTREVPWYRDSDGDGFGADGPATRLSCEPLTSMGYSLLRSDCDDTTRAISPAATEMCNGRDDDCNGVADFRIAAGDFEDDDADGVVDLACGAPFGEDCDDNNPATGPGSPEICDGRDNDCDANVDEGATSAVFYRDEDMDGFGATTGGTIVGCMGMPGYVALGGDCDDMDAARRPGATETCNGEDDDCNGAADDGVALPALPHATVGCVAGMTSIVRCDPNYENCNGVTTDGCEADLATDMNNCRFCGNVCASTGGESRMCVAGDCRITSCPAGRRDCNGSAVDGCERTIGTTTDCGDCNDRCALAHVTTQSCVAGACTFAAGDCEPGWADCDGNVATGCETPTGTLTNCSACGDACTAMQYCDASTHTCQTTTTMCTAPQADCDMNGSCETNTATSLTNCGACGRACSGGNATWSCVGGGCTVTACTGGYHDCDGLAANGCEASPTSVSACGASCQVCVIPNGTPACTGGACAVASCSSGWGNCNGLATDGCETNQRTDAANCGGCGIVCNNLANVATGTCLSGSCNVVVCDPGYANCDGNSANGCETSIDADPANCGACGRNCGVGGECGTGVCDEILQVANGQYHTCALRSSGTVVCWGTNTNGQLGDGTNAQRLTPVLVPGLTDVVDIAAGWEHTCALLANGRVRCWGGNGQDQLGDGSGSDQSSPVAVIDEGTMTELTGITEIEVGRYASCGLRTSGRLVCWGQNAGGLIDPFDGGVSSYAYAHDLQFDQCGDGCTQPYRALHFTVGAQYVAAILAFSGKGTYVELWTQGDAPGDVGTSPDTNYIYFGELSDIVELASGNDHICVRRTSGIVECIGDNASGQLGDGSLISPVYPVLSLFTSATALMLFDDTTCVRNALGQVYCMGATNEAQTTGPGSASPVLSPKRVNVSSGGAAYSARVLANGGGGAYRTPCLISTAGAVHCWGNNIGGSIGNGSTVGQEYPTRVLNLTP